MTNNNSFKESKFRKIRHSSKIILYFVILLCFLLCGIFAFVIVNKDNNLSKWIVDNSILKNYIKLNNKVNNDNENKLSANSFFSLNDEKDKYRFATMDKSLSSVDLVEKEIPSVVSINVTSEGNKSFSQEQIAGTGYFVDKSGLIVTNKHVISTECNPKKKVKVTAVTYDQKVYELQLLSIDPVEDMAILKVIKPDKEFSPVQFTNSNNLKLGTEVMAIGNALGELQNTVTKGIISGLNRNLNQPIQDECTGKEILPDNLIQTDAAINKGNSGGPLFDNTGLLIGMNTYGTGGENIGLAIPSNRIISGLNSFQTNGKIIRPKLGVSTQSISAVIKENNPWLPIDYGEFIYANGANPITADSAADKVGLKEGDIILEVNSTKLVKSSSISSPLKSILLGFDANTEIELTILRTTKIQTEFKYGNPEKIKVKLGGQSIDLSTLILK
ncbi:MAG: trypsin-like peptidase domain-containing protein [candidate division SR1 bacterium]|nr:trypsin-like peptidase domain-containing protein [candidate division SR1 bacterium]